MVPEETPRAPVAGAAPETPAAAALRACGGAARGTLSPNTERALKADLELFARWCAERDLSALPATVASVAAFVDAMAELRAPATVRRYVASIGAAHRAIGLAKTTKDADVRFALRRMHRRKGRRQGQALGLTWPLRERLLAAPGDRLIDDRNRALVAVAYDALLRRSELTALGVEDLMEEVDGSGALLVRRGKSDPEGQGAVVYLAPDTVGLVRAWCRRAGISAGRLYRSVGKGGRLGASLDASQIPRIFKAMARRAGLPAELAEGLSGHSARIGAAQDMIASGIGMPAVLQAGRWKTPTMVNRYGERVLARHSGAAQLARLQERQQAIPAREGRRRVPGAGSRGVGGEETT